MKKRLAISMFVILFVAAAMGGATMAWFTDETEAPESTFEAGTVKATIDGDVEIPDWNPGDSDCLCWNITSEGSKDTKVQVLFNNEWELDAYEESDLNGGEDDSWLYYYYVENRGMAEDEYYKIISEWNEKDDEDKLANITVNLASESDDDDDYCEDAADNNDYNPEDWDAVEDNNDNVIGYRYTGDSLEEDEEVSLCLIVHFSGPLTDNMYQGATLTFTGMLHAIQASYAGEWDWDNVDFETGLEDE